MDLLLVMLFDYMMLLAFAAMALHQYCCYPEGENDDETIFLQDSLAYDWDD